MADGAPPFDVAILGAGVMGCASAWRASLAGLRVLLLEAQPSAAHALGSSHGHSRIVRRTYAQAHYVAMMGLAYPLWEEASACSGAGGLRAWHERDGSEPPLVRTTGGLTIVGAGGAEHHGLVASCASCGVRLAELDAACAAARYGLSLPPGTVALEQGDTGVAVGAGRACSAMLQLATSAGAVTRMGARVVRALAVRQPLPVGEWLVQLTLSDGSTAHCKRLVLTPGAWAAPLVERLCGLALPLRVWQCTTAYYPLLEREGGCSSSPLEPLPVLIDCGDSTSPDAPRRALMYACPVTPWGDEARHRGCIKVAVHEGAPTTADGRSFEPHAALTLAPVTAWLSAHAPRVVGATPVDGSAVTCLYTMTPDEDFILDGVDLRRESAEGDGGGDHTAISGLAFLACGFSGHGFKFAPLIGEIAAQWALAALAQLPTPMPAALRPATLPRAVAAVEAWLQARMSSATPILGAFSLTRPALLPLLRRAALHPDDVFLTDYTRASLAALPATPNFDVVPIADQRRAQEAAAAAAAARHGAPPPMGHVRDHVTTSGCELRVFTPTGPDVTDGACVLYLHGGGWALGTRTTHDAHCRRVAIASACALVFVSYRLSPEAVYPAALDDCVAAYAWACAAYPRGVVLLGDSSGGNLAAALALRLRDEARVAVDGLAPPPPIAQVLIYPAIDASCSTPSMTCYRDGFGLTAAAMRFYWSLYLCGAPPPLRAHASQEAWAQLLAGEGGVDDSNAAAIISRAALAYACPMRAQDLSGLPPAFIATAECDVLRDESLAWGERLTAAGVSVEVRQGEGRGQRHAFFRDNPVDNPGARALVEAVGEFVRRSVRRGA